MYHYWQPLKEELCRAGVSRGQASLSVMYMDDVSIGGTLEDVQNDLQVIKDAEILGLSLNPKKCELVCVDHTVRGHLTPSWDEITDSPPKREDGAE